MESLEERLVEALTALREDEPGSEGHMFVFPIALMGSIDCFYHGHRIVRAGDVLLICRDEPQA